MDSRSLVLLVVALWATAARGQESPLPDACASPPIPPGLLGNLADSYPGWTAVRLTDLEPDDRELWLKSSRATQCPGVVSGRFVSAQTPAWAVVAVSGGSGNQRVMVLLGQPGAKGRFSFRTALAPESAVRPAVVWALPPGEYRMADGRLVKTKLDSIVVEHIEAGALLLVWKQGRFDRLVYSQ